MSLCYLLVCVTKLVTMFTIALLSLLLLQKEERKKKNNKCHH